MPPNSLNACHFPFHAHGNEEQSVGLTTEVVMHTSYPALHQDGCHVAAAEAQPSDAVRHNFVYWLNTYGAADKLRMSPTTVRVLIREGKLAAYRICNRYWILPEDIEAFLSSVQTQAK